MNYQSFVGIDIGKDEFVAGFDSTQKTSVFNNAPEGWNRFIEEHKILRSDGLIVLEATGGFESGLAKVLVKEGFAVHRADTRKVKNFIRSFGKYAKTDAIDALALANYGKERGSRLPLFLPLDPIQEKLRLLAERRMDLTQMLVQEKNRAKAPLNKPLLPSISVVIKCLEEQLSDIGKAIDELTLENEELIKRKRVLLKIAGIGNITANALLALLPELGLLDRRKIASLAGLAPHPKQSGQKTWYSPTVGGRRDLRPILFMAALGAIRKRDSEFAEFYYRLIANGKKKMVAITAVMRKLVVIANARLRDELYVSTTQI